MTIDWDALRAAAIEVMRRAYAPYSKFPVGAAALTADGRVVAGCNVENASYGMTLCAECGLISALHASGGGRLVALACVDGDGEPLMPCGRCRQLLWEHGGPQCLIDARPRPVPMSELLPHAFGVADLVAFAAGAPQAVPGAALVPAGLARWHGQGTVFVHPDIAGAAQVWTGYWSGAGSSPTASGPAGILEEAPTWSTAAEGIDWGRARTPRVVVVDADGGTFWAGPGPAPEEIEHRWPGY